MQNQQVSNDSVCTQVDVCVHGSELFCLSIELKWSADIVSSSPILSPILHVTNALPTTVARTNHHFSQLTYLLTYLLACLLACLLAYLLTYLRTYLLTYLLLII